MYSGCYYTGVYIRACDCVRTSVWHNTLTKSYANPAIFVALRWTNQGDSRFVFAISSVYRGAVLSGRGGPDFFLNSNIMYILKRADLIQVSTLSCASHTGKQLYPVGGLFDESFFYLSVSFLKRNKKFPENGTKPMKS